MLDYRVKVLGVIITKFHLVCLALLLKVHFSYIGRLSEFGVFLFLKFLVSSIQRVRVKKLLGLPKSLSVHLRFSNKIPEGFSI